MFNLFKKNLLNPLNAGITKSVDRQGEDFSADAIVTITEVVSGNLFSPGKVIVEQTGTLSGSISSKTAVIDGTVIGNIDCTEQMDIKSTAVIKGDIKSPIINIEEGAEINGHKATKPSTISIINLLEEIKVPSTTEFIKLSETPSAINKTRRERFVL